MVCCRECHRQNRRLVHGRCPNCVHRCGAPTKSKSDALCQNPVRNDGDRCNLHLLCPDPALVDDQLVDDHKTDDNDDHKTDDNDDHKTDDDAVAGRYALEIDGMLRNAQLLQMWYWADDQFVVMPVPVEATDVGSSKNMWKVGGYEVNPRNMTQQSRSTGYLRSIAISVDGRVYMPTEPFEGNEYPAKPMQITTLDNLQEKIVEFLASFGFARENIVCDPDNVLVPDGRLGGTTRATFEGVSAKVDTYAEGLADLLGWGAWDKKKVSHATTEEAAREILKQKLFFNIPTRKRSGIRTKDGVQNNQFGIAAYVVPDEGQKAYRASLQYGGRDQGAPYVFGISAIILAPTKGQVYAVIKQGDTERFQLEPDEGILGVDNAEDPSLIAVFPPQYRNIVVTGLWARPVIG